MLVILVAVFSTALAENTLSKLLIAVIVLEI